MDPHNVCSAPSEGDLRAALKEMKTYVDITEEDLIKIYEIAARHARERIARMVPVSEVMTKDVVTIKRNADLNEAARLLSENRISGMPVVDDDNRVIGVISEADILILAGLKKEPTFMDIVHAVLGDPKPAHKKASRAEDVMSFPPITSKPDDGVMDVALILDERRIKRLPVVDSEGRLLGIISRADIVRSMGKK